LKAIAFVIKKYFEKKIEEASLIPNSPNVKGGMIVFPNNNNDTNQKSFRNES